MRARAHTVRHDFRGLPCARVTQLQVDEWRQPIGRKPVSSFLFLFFVLFYDFLRNNARRVFSGTKKSADSLFIYVYV